MLKKVKGRAKPWKFFQRMNEIIGHRPNVHPEFCIDTSAGKKKGNTDTDNGEELEKGNNRIWFQGKTININI